MTPREVQRREKSKILLVEDDHLIRPLIKAMLYQYDVLDAKNGNEAREILETHGGMPVISDHNYTHWGLEALHAWMEGHLNPTIKKSAILA